MAKIVRGKTVEDGQYVYLEMNGKRKRIIVRYWRKNTSKVIIGEASKGYKRKIYTGQYKSMGKYALLKRFHHDP